MVGELSTKDMKVVLTKNMVDYSEFLEKREFVAAIHRLMDNHTKEIKLAKESERNEDDTEFCKICYERVINCVFLECGHMFSCVECGRKLNECPLCRERIVRIVHTFRS